MTTFTRTLPLLGLLVLAAACGGGETPPPEPSATEQPTSAPQPAPPTQAQAATGRVHEVRMLTTQNGASGVFEPANLTVQKGDVIRFVGEGAAVHNANFNVPENAGKSGLPAATTFLAAGQTADVTVTMDAGTYTYQCDPHAAMGMKGTVTVQ